MVEIIRKERERERGGIKRLRQVWKQARKLGKSERCLSEYKDWYGKEV